MSSAAVVSREHRKEIIQTFHKVDFPSARLSAEDKMFNDQIKLWGYAHRSYRLHLIEA